MTLDEIQKALATETSPITIAEYRVVLSHKYGVAVDKLTDIKLQKAIQWLELRKEYKSVAETDRAWEATETGQQEIIWEHTKKKIERMLSATKTLIDARNTEYFNNN